ncbi:MAG: flagellar motor switch protein FliM [Thermodesulfobacteriota bacterium]
MENILSQQEIDALLKGISSGEIQTDAPPPAQIREVRRYDLTRHDRIVQGKIPAVDVMLDRFAHYLMATFTSAFRRMAEVTPASSGVKKFRDFLKSLPMPASIHLFRMEPLHGPGLLVLEPALVYLLIEFIMGGGQEGQLKIEGRDFTNIENRLIVRLVKEALRDLEKAWGMLQPVRVQFERSEMNPQFAAVMLPSDLVLCVHLDVEMEAAKGNLVLCLPFAFVEPFRDRLPGWGSDRQRKERLWLGYILDHLEEAKVLVSAELGGLTVRLKEILEMRVGQEIWLDGRADSLIPVKVEGTTKFLALPGHYNGRNAVRLMRTAREKEPQGQVQPSDHLGRR